MKSLGTTGNKHFFSGCNLAYPQESAKIVYERVTVRTSDDLCFFGTPESKRVQKQKHTSHICMVLYKITQMCIIHFWPLSHSFPTSNMVMLKTRITHANYSVFLDTYPAQKSVILLCISLIHMKRLQKNTSAFANSHLTSSDLAASPPKSHVTTTVFW